MHAFLRVSEKPLSHSGLESESYNTALRLHYRLLTFFYSAVIIVAHNRFRTSIPSDIGNAL
jgi:hypothetical protein